MTDETASAVQDSVNALRILSMDQVQEAGSGHPGAPMGLADVAYLLWKKHLDFNPLDPDWINRDRVLFSNGHCSALQYSVLHLCGYDLGLDDLKNFRQLGSRTPGHPELGITPGVEVTTGPLGQGLANGVGMALAQKNLAQRFNTAEHAVFDHRIWVFAGDGCFMEGIANEAMSLAGQWNLDNLVVLYDQNGVSIDGEIEGWFSEDIGQRARGCGWRVMENIDGHNRGEIDRALALAKETATQPTLLCLRTRIGFGSPNKVDSADCHGAPLGVNEVGAARQNLGWSDSAPFEIPESIRQDWDMRAVGRKKQRNWQLNWRAWSRQRPRQVKELTHLLGLNDDGLLLDPARRKQVRLKRMDTVFSELMRVLEADTAASTRQMSGKCIAALNQHCPEIIGGSADLSQSNCVLNSHSKIIDGKNYDGNTLHYGAREFAMVAINNGIGIYGGHIPYSASFLIFTDYARNAIRMSALMRQTHILVMTHDSIHLGEDGPTHQPIEQLESLRLIPNLNLWRPASANETKVAWGEALNHQGPSVLSLTRQKLSPGSHLSQVKLEYPKRGGYVVFDDEDFEFIIMATGSEMVLVESLLPRLTSHRVRLVSIPCREVFLAQDREWQDYVLPPDHKKRVAVEAGCDGYWHRLIGDRGLFIGIKTFGCSAKAADVARFKRMDADSVLSSLLDYFNQNTNN